MAYVDETFVREYLEREVRLPGLTYETQSADCESEDAGVKILLNGADTQLSVQCGGGYLGLNLYLYRDNGDLYGVRHLLTCGVQPQDLVSLARKVRQQCVSLIPAQNDESGHCKHCGRDNSEYPDSSCSDDCPLYWEEQGVQHPEHKMVAAQPG